METVILMGAEKVEQAGRNISSAAETMANTFRWYQEEQERQREFMNERLARFEAAVARLAASSRR